ncbi:MAG: hypothetical protein E7Z80_08490 [Methanobrevibacter thaueri]|nr:hypothetical protein [Methanobrevibacter thaueri]
MERIQTNNKSAKGAFGLGKFHRFTDKFIYKNIYLCLLLTAIVVQTGFKTKTQLQQLAEGKIEFKQLKNKNSKKQTKNRRKTHEKKTQTPKEYRTTTTKNRIKTRPHNTRLIQINLAHYIIKKPNRNPTNKN